MIKKTHLAIGLALGLYFLPFMTHKVLFIPIILIASVLPDIDSVNANIGKHKIFRPLQSFLEHRGPLHSYTVVIILSLVLAFFYPVFALPFFLGYSIHLFADSFTVRGIRPFWPFKFHTEGIVKTGGIVDRSLFYVFMIVDLFLFVMLFLRI
mgnify:CR=1 FL=1